MSSNEILSNENTHSDALAHIRRTVENVFLMWRRDRVIAKRARTPWKFDIILEYCTKRKLTSELCGTFFAALKLTLRANNWRRELSDSCIVAFFKSVTSTPDEISYLLNLLCHWMSEPFSDSSATREPSDTVHCFNWILEYEIIPQRTLAIWCLRAIWKDPILNMRNAYHDEFLDYIKLLGPIYPMLSRIYDAENLNEPNSDNIDFHVAQCKQAIPETASSMSKTSKCLIEHLEDPRLKQMLLNGRGVFGSEGLTLSRDHTGLRYFVTGSFILDCNETDFPEEIARFEEKLRKCGESRVVSRWKDSSGSAVTLRIPQSQAKMSFPKYLLTTTSIEVGVYHCGICYAQGDEESHNLRTAVPVPIKFTPEEFAQHVLEHDPTTRIDQRCGCYRTLWVSSGDSHALRCSSCVCFQHCFTPGGKVRHLFSDRERGQKYPGCNFCNSCSKNMENVADFEAHKLFHCKFCRNCLLPYTEFSMTREEHQNQCHRCFCGSIYTTKSECLDCRISCLKRNVYLPRSES